MNGIRNAVLIVAALALIGALVFLYNKTQAVDLREQNEVLGQLRTLKEIDARWDVDVLQAQLEPLSHEFLPVARGDAVKSALGALTNSAQSTSSPTLMEGLPALENAIAQKAALVDDFNAQNHETRVALQTLLANSATLGEQLAAQKPRPIPVENALAQLTAAAPQYYSLGDEVQRKATAAAAEELQTTSQGLPTALHDRATTVATNAQALLKFKPLAQADANKLAFLSSGPRLNNLAFSFGRELEDTLQDKERYRVYLIAYAGALLILLAYLGAKLKAANVGLEQRVRERTQELSDAMRHLQESEAQLIQSEKMSSLGQMVAGVAHEINTPLAYTKASLASVSEKLPEIEAGISGSQQVFALLRAGASAPAEELNRQFAATSGRLTQLKQQRVMEELKGLVKDGLYGAGQVAEIVSNLKDFSRVDRVKVASFNLNDGLASTLILAKHILKTVTVDKHFGDLPSITCSPSQINQVFLNLITNAVQAMEAGKGKLTLVTQRADNGVAVIVIDNGKGIAPDVLPKIFDPFFSTKEIGKGTGLGLSISYTIVQQHGGRINVESKVNIGTKFTVWLPLTPPVAAAA